VQSEITLGRAFSRPAPLKLAVAGVTEPDFPPEVMHGQPSEGPGLPSPGGGQRPGTSSGFRGRERALRRPPNAVRRPERVIPRSPAGSPRPGDAYPGGILRSEGLFQPSQTLGELSRGQWGPSEDDFGRPFLLCGAAAIEFV